MAGDFNFHFPKGISNWVWSILVLLIFATVILLGWSELREKILNTNSSKVQLTTSIPDCKSIDRDLPSAEDLMHSNMFIVTREIYMNVTKNNNGQGSVILTFKIVNVTDGGISILFTRQQERALKINYPGVSGCKHTSTLPLTTIPVASDNNWNNLRREALYIPKRAYAWVTVDFKSCSVSKITRSKWNAFFSGSITVMKGRRLLSRPIGGSLKCTIFKADG